MTSSRPVWILVAMAAVLGLFSLVALPSSETLAQSPPTPTNIASPAPPGAGGKGGEEGPPPGPPGALVSGFVYDYSNAARQPGVTVVIDGGGWLAEVVSDSNGFYQFGNLGSGAAVLNLRLPAGAHAVAPNWPVSFGSGAHVRVNLGYYWGDTPPLPVLLSGELRGSTLVVQVENRTGEPATGGLVDILLPVGIQAVPGVRASQGVVDYSEGRVRVAWERIPPRTRATVDVLLEQGGTAMPVSRGPGWASPSLSAPSSDIQTMFTYDQQITPQLVAVDFRPVSRPSNESLMPITGSGLGSGGLLNLFLPILMILGLGIAGWRAIRIR
jgi:hypothetical protein